MHNTLLVGSTNHSVAVVAAAASGRSAGGLASEVLPAHQKEMRTEMNPASSISVFVVRGQKLQHEAKLAITQRYYSVCFSRLQTKKCEIYLDFTIVLWTDSG